MFRNEDEESIDSHKPSNIGSRISGKDKADAASSPESFESARDGVSNFFMYFLLNKNKNNKKLFLILIIYKNY